jgi:hypothetical protein
MGCAHCRIANENDVSLSGPLSWCPALSTLVIDVSGGLSRVRKRSNRDTEVNDKIQVCDDNFQPCYQHCPTNC